MEFNDWWFNLRFSKTEPLARLNIETAEKSKFQKESNRIKKFLK
jgi:phosphomannomutase